MCVCGLMYISDHGVEYYSVMCCACVCVCVWVYVMFCVTVCVGVCDVLCYCSNLSMQPRVPVKEYPLLSTSLPGMNDSWHVISAFLMVYSEILYYTHVTVM